MNPRKQAAKNHGIMAHEIQFQFLRRGGIEGDLENCAYLWKNPGYAPVRENSKEYSFVAVIWNYRHSGNSDCSLLWAIKVAQDKIVFEFSFFTASNESDFKVAYGRRFLYSS